MVECQALRPDTNFLGGSSLSHFTHPQTGPPFCSCFNCTVLREASYQEALSNTVTHSHWVTHPWGYCKALNLTSTRTCHNWFPPTLPNLPWMLFYVTQRVSLLVGSAYSVLGFAQSLCTVLQTSSADSANLWSWWFHVHTNFFHPNFPPSIWNNLYFNCDSVFPTPFFSLIK